MLKRRKKRIHVIFGKKRNANWDTLWEEWIFTSTHHQKVLSTGKTCVGGGKMRQDTFYTSDTHESMWCRWWCFCLLHDIVKYQIYQAMFHLNNGNHYTDHMYECGGACPPWRSSYSWYDLKLKARAVCQQRPGTQIWSAGRGGHCSVAGGGGKGSILRYWEENFCQGQDVFYLQRSCCYWV